jgi:4-hydroxybenzoyl-CoA reductase subunit beta
MILPELGVLKTEKLAEALRLLKENSNAKPLAGGTDLLVLLKQRTVDVKYLIDISKLSELEGIDVQGGDLCIGAAVRLVDIAENSRINRDFPALAEAARSVASPNLRNMATIGGNLCLAPRCLYYNQSQFWRASLGRCLKTGGDVCSAVPGSKRCYACFSADCPPALIALGATVTVARWEKESITERRILLADLYREDGVRPLTLAPEELVTAIHLPLREGLCSTYVKYRRRASIDFPLTGVAVAFALEEGRFKNIRIVLNALASSPVLAGETMTLLEGKPYGEQVMEESMIGLTRGTHPVRNQAGSPEHRRRMTRILFRRAVERLIKE